MILEQDELRKILPQAYPFILIDRVEDIKINESLVAIKNITSTEWCFEGSDEIHHYPETLIIEAAAQAALVLYHVSKVRDNSQKRYFIGKSDGEFFQQAHIGDELKITILAGKLMDTGGYCDAELSIKSSQITKLNFIFKVSNA